MLGALLILTLGFAILSLTVTGFFSLLNFLTALVLAAAIILIAVVSRVFVDNRSAFIGLMVLAALFVVASLHVSGFVSGANIKSMLVFASFLGLATVGQTLVALLGGFDLSIPFIIGSSNVGLLYLIGLGIPSPIAVILILLIGGAIGFVNGLLSFRLQGQALIVTLGVGFAVSGLTQILTSIGTAFAGNVFGQVPNWLKQSRRNERHHFRSRSAAGHLHLDRRRYRTDFRHEEHGLRPLRIRVRRQPHVGAAHLHFGARATGSAYLP